jgi:hypothetical protein
MTISPVAETGALLELARGLDPLQRQILLNLQEKGPGLLFELAVRVFKLPEAINDAVADLRAKNLIRVENISGSAYGNELLRLSDLGARVVRLLRDPALAQELAPRPPAAAQAAEAAAAQPADARQQELELLKTLADLAVRQGDLQKASQYYEEALQLARQQAAS